MESMDTSTELMDCGGATSGVNVTQNEFPVVGNPIPTIVSTFSRVENNDQEWSASYMSETPVESSFLKTIYPGNEGEECNGKPIATLSPQWGAREPSRKRKYPEFFHNYNARPLKQKRSEVESIFPKVHLQDPIRILSAEVAACLDKPLPFMRRPPENWEQSHNAESSSRSNSSTPDPGIDYWSQLGVIYDPDYVPEYTLFDPPRPRKPTPFEEYRANQNLDSVENILKRWN